MSLKEEWLSVSDKFDCGHNIRVSLVIFGYLGIGKLRTSLLRVPNAKAPIGRGLEVSYPYYCFSRLVLEVVAIPVA